MDYALAPAWCGGRPADERPMNAGNVTKHQSGLPIEEARVPQIVEKKLGIEFISAEKFPEECGQQRSTKAGLYFDNRLGVSDLPQINRFAFSSGRGLPEIGTDVLRNNPPAGTRLHIE